MKHPAQHRVNRPAGPGGRHLRAGAPDRRGRLWSGDNARQDEHGYFHFIDRAKDMIKRTGENGDRRREVIVAVVVPVEGEKPGKGEIHRLVQRKAGQLPRAGTG